MCMRMMIFSEFDHNHLNLCRHVHVTKALRACARDQSFVRMRMVPYSRYKRNVCVCVHVCVCVFFFVTFFCSRAASVSFFCSRAARVSFSCPRAHYDTSMRIYAYINNFIRVRACMAGSLTFWHTNTSAAMPTILTLTPFSFSFPTVSYMSPRSIEFSDP
jgi:hypothetical protein